MDYFTNPIDQQFFLPLIGRVGGVLLILLLALLFFAIKDGRRLSDDVLLTRWRTWLVIATIAVAALLSGAVPFTLLVVAMVVQGCLEYARLVELPSLYRRVLIAMGMAAPPAALVSVDVFYMIAPVFLILATLQPLRTFHRDRDSIRHLAFAAFGWGYIAWFLAHLVMIHQYSKDGIGILILLFTGVALSDVGAYVFGRTFGKSKLAPQISPNKTRAGLVGNFAGAYAGWGIMSFAIPDSAPLGFVLVMPAVTAIGSLWGDLVESVLKREFRVKDTGTWLPGFGGLLDRIDSLILVAPLSYYLLRLLG